MEFSGVFWKIYDAYERRPRYISNKGGARSTKTYSTLQFLHLLIPQVDTSRDITSVVSESFPHLRTGAIRDFENIIGHPLKGDDHWSETAHTWTYDNGAKLEFFSADTPQKVHGPQRKRLFINEANHIPWEIFRQLAVRTAGVIFLDYNPASVCWIQEKVECKPNCTLIRSTYKDNPFLSDLQVREIEDNQSDENWWKVYGLGLEGTLEGVVYDFTQIDTLPDPTGLVEVYGMDFGYTNDPSTLVRVFADTKRKVIYADELLYRTHMLNRDIIAHMKEVGVSRTAEVLADCAEPKSVEEIYFAGFNCKPCYKGKAIVEQIQFIQGWELKVTKRSTNLIKELRNYTWAKDKEGKQLNVPIDAWNHCFAAGTMVLTERGERPIETIREGERVWTSQGLRRVSKTFRNGLREVLELKINFEGVEKTFKVTSDHKFKTKGKWKQAKDLTRGDRLYLASCSTASNTTSMRAKDISAVEGSVYTLPCGSIITGWCLPVTRFTTKISMQRTTKSRISFASQSRSTKLCTESAKAHVEGLLNHLHLWRESGRLQRLGTPARRGTSGTPNTGRKLLRQLSRRGIYVSVVDRNFGVRSMTQNSAPTPVSQDTVERLEPTKRCASASVAERISQRTITVRPRLVRSLAVAKCIGGVEEVFDIEVEGMHEFYANGVLVHNCLDALRYAVFTKFATFKRPLTGGKPKASKAW